MSNYRRDQTCGGTWFFTVNLADRRSDLLTKHIGLLRQAHRKVKQAHPFAIDAMVVLPDHLHAIWTLPADDVDFPTRWRLIKKTFSLALPRFEPISASRQQQGERGIWQRRYWEHRIRDEADFARHVDYIHINPVKHGHSSCASDWPFSSFHRFVHHGLLSADWAAD